MAKIEDKSLYVGITPYEHEGQTYDVLNVTAGYRKGRGFSVNVHPGWKSDFGFGCMFDLSQNPLSDTTWVDVMEAPKNSQKTIDAMHANLRAETAQKIIRLLFDQRMWSALKTGLKHIALNSQWATEELLASLSKKATDPAPDPAPTGVGSGAEEEPEPQPQDRTFEHTDKQGLRFVLKLFAIGNNVHVRVLSADGTLLWHNEKSPDTWYDAQQVYEMTKARIINEDDDIHTKFNNSKSSEDESMKLNLSNNNETKNAAKQQVNNNASEPIVKQVDVMGLMGALSRDGHAKLSDHVIEDAEAVEVKDEQAEEIESVNVGEVTLATIMPKMQVNEELRMKNEESATAQPTKQEVAEAIVKAAETGEATTKPLGKHGTLVIASGGGEKPAKSEEGRVKSEEFATAAEKPQTSNLKSQTSRYAVQLLPSKSGGVWPKLYGFKSEKEAKAVAEKMPSSVNAKWDYGVNGEGRETKTRHWYLSAGKRYCDVMQELADALNKGDRVAVANAAAKACGVYAGVVAENKSKSDADPKPKREKKQEAKANTDGTDKTDKPAAPAATGYSKEDVAAMLRDVLAGKALPKEVAELMAA